MKIKGFTLVELLIVMAIISILVTLVLIAVNPVRVINDSRDTANRSEMNQLKTALQLYFNDNNSYPAGPDPSGELVPTYMRQYPTFTIDYGESGTDYDAATTVNNTSTEDTNSATKCTVDGNNGVAGDYWICPD